MDGLITGLEPRADGAAHGLWFEMQPWVMFPPSESCVGLQLSAKRHGNCCLKAVPPK